jgi:hypothetical protein
MPHTTRPCSRPACAARIPRSQYACRNDWFALPKPIRDAINTAWRTGGPAAILTDAYRNATAAAQASWETRDA